MRQRKRNEKGCRSPDRVEDSQQNPFYHFVDTEKTIPMPKGVGILPPPFKGHLWGVSICDDLSGPRIILMPPLFLDCYPLANEIVVWLWVDGKMQRFVDTFYPKVYARCDLILNLQQALASFKINSILKRKKLFTGESIQVLEISVYDIATLRNLIRDIEREKGYDVDLFNADIAPEQYYLFEKGLFPFCEVEFYHDNSNVLAIKNVDRDGWEYHIPPLKLLELDITTEDPLEKGFLTEIKQISIDGVSMAGSEKEILSGFRKRFLGIDPDIVLTRHGNITLPYLKGRLRYHGLDLNFSRIDPDELSYRGGKSYFSYGRVLYKDYPVFLRGRLHLDRDAFLFSEAGLYGVVELSRTCRMPVQRMGMRSPGSGISNLQCYQAFKENYLIPYKKSLVEKFKTALQLFEADRGGIIYEPITGFHENVAELDFSSMYPSIMVKHNISPETVLCECCNQENGGCSQQKKSSHGGDGGRVGSYGVPRRAFSRGENDRLPPWMAGFLLLEECRGSSALSNGANLVPGIGYHICTKRIGLIPKVLRPIIERRLYYKSHPNGINDARKAALKWILVTCFGYMGFRKAKFGRIEAHEAINAYARQHLLDASRIIEQHGFQIVHGIIDSMYIKKDGREMVRGELEQMCREIEEAVHIPIAIGGIYRWMVFLPSVGDKRIPVPTRFYGVFDDGRLKARGIEMRKSDTPLIVYRMQEEMLEALKTAVGQTGFAGKIPLLIGILKRYVGKLSHGASPGELVITKKISKLGYSSAIPQGIIAKKLLAGGVKLSPGNDIRYIIKDMGSEVKDSRFVTLKEFDGSFDKGKYKELLVRAALVFLEPFGHQKEGLMHALDTEKQLRLGECG